jgi:hypothetical protein
MRILIHVTLGLLLLALLPTAVAAQAAAQEEDEVEQLVIHDHEIEAARKLMRTERRLVHATELALTPEESKAFWPLYNDYAAEQARIGDRKVKLITSYAENFDHITDKFADRALTESFMIDTAHQTVRDRYRSKFKRILPIIKVVRFYQVENKLDAIINFQLAAQIPLMVPPE